MPHRAPGAPGKRPGNYLSGKPITYYRPTGSAEVRNLLEHGFQTWEWKQALVTATLDSLPVAADAKPIQSVRHTVVSWNCGNAKRRVPVKKKVAPGGTAAKKAKPAPKASAVRAEAANK